MANIIGIKLGNAGKVYYYDVGGLEVSLHSSVIIETSAGKEFGTVTELCAHDEPSDAELHSGKIVRVATDEDMKKVNENAEKSKSAFKICKERIEKHKLDMRLVDAEYIFDTSKILFYFTADGRVDFRDLVKDLATVLKTRIELRQIGVRDKARSIGGLGVCGRILCCKCCVKEFQPVSVNMAKSQCVSLNPTKISGVCGRLMCCLRHEKAVYDELVKKVPKVGAVVTTSDGQGTVVEVHLLKELVKVRLYADSEKEGDVRTYNVKDIKKTSKETQEIDSQDTSDTAKLKELEDK